MSYPFTPIKKYSVKILKTIVTCMMSLSLFFSMPLTRNQIKEHTLL